jgi:hypothetical protein
MRLVRSLCFFAVSLCLSFPLVSRAQSVDTAGLEVDVRDPSGAHLPGATLTLTQTQTHDKRVGVSDSHGRYRFVELPVGSYDLLVEKDGFSALHQTGVTLSVGQAAVLSADLKVSDTSATVQVNADVSTIDPDKTTIGQTISTEEIDNLPSDGRNFLDFAVTVPNVTITQTSGQNSGFSVNGQRSRSNSIMIDGVENNGALNGNVRQTLSQDAIAQFQVLTEQAPAEFGGAGGGFINVVTRAGTDRFHGSLYYFMRNNFLNTPNYFANVVPNTYSRNDVGMSLGGPIKPNRTYFYGALEYIGFNTSVFSNFCHANAPGCTSTTYDTVNNTLATGALIGSPVRGLDFDQYIPRNYAQTLSSLRVDHRISDRDTLIARVLYVQYIQAQSTNAGSIYDISTATGTYTHTQNYFTEWTHIFSPKLLNEAHFMVAPQRLKQLPHTYGVGADIAGTVYVGPTGDFPVTLDEDHYEADDALSYTRGAHLLKGGVQINYIRAHSNFDTDFNGYWNFYSGSNFASGIPYRFTQNFGNPDIHLPDLILGAYLEDSWKVFSRLTVNAGVRYDLDLQPQGFNQNAGDPVQANLSQGMNRDYNNFAPRLALAYSLDSKGKTILRAGYGMFYDKNLLILARNTLQTKNTLIYNYNNSSTAALQALWKTGPYPRSTAYPSIGIAPTVARAWPYQVLPLTHQMDLGIDRAITSKLVFSVTGLHVAGEKLLKVTNSNLAAPIIMTTANQQNFGYAAYNPNGAACTSVNSSIARSSCQPPYQMLGRPMYLNYTDPTTGAVRSPRLDSHLNDITLTGNWGHSNYNALRVSLVQAAWHGLTARAGFTWSRAEDDSPDFLNGNYPDNPYNPAAERSLSNEDIRNRFTGTLVYRVPFALSGRKHDWVRQVLGNWIFSGFMNESSGAPENITVGSDINFDDGSLDRPFINGAIVGRNTFRGERNSSVQVRGQKEIHLMRGTRFVFSAEAFNVFSHLNITDHLTTWGTNQAPGSTFGNRVSASDSRTMQLGFRYIF